MTRNELLQERIHAIYTATDRNSALRALARAVADTGVNVEEREAKLRAIRDEYEERGHLTRQSFNVRASVAASLLADLPADVARRLKVVLGV